MTIHQNQKTMAGQAVTVGAATDRERVNLALRELLGITDPDAGALLRFAANALAAHADQLLRTQFQKELGNERA